jgi:tight adherence protein B
MIAPFTIVLILGGLAGLMTLFALAMALRDVVGRRNAPAVESKHASSPLEASSNAGSLDRALQRLVEESGTRFEPGAVLMLIIGSAAVCGTLAWGLTEHLLVIAAAVLVGPVLPLFWLAFARWRRLRKIRKNLPATLEVVADAVRGGRNLQQTFELVSQEINSCVGPEFARAARQLGLGDSPEAVLNRMARRLPVPEFRIFATAVTVHQQSGGNLALLTERLAASARDREQFYGHLSAVTIGSRMSAIGLFFGSLIGVLILSMIEPTYLQTFATNMYGPALIVIAATLQLTGIFWVWRVLRVHF